MILQTHSIYIHIYIYIYISDLARYEYSSLQTKNVLKV